MTDSERGEPDRTEPDQTEPDRTEPYQAESGQTEPYQAESGQTEPYQAESGQTEPDQTQPDWTKAWVLLRLYNPTWAAALSVTVRIKLANAFFDTWLEQTVSTAAAPHHEEEIRLPFVSRWSGVLRASVAQVEIRDLLGWITWRMEPDVSAELVILPEENEEGAPGRLYDPMTAEADCGILGEDHSEVSDIRDYQPGDRMRDIDWKRFSGRGELLVKVRSACAEEVMTLVLSLEGMPELVDKNVKRAYGLCIYFVKLGLPVRMLWWRGGREGLNQAVMTSPEEINEGFERMFRDGRREPEEDLRRMMNIQRPEISAYLYLEPAREPVLTGGD